MSIPAFGWALVRGADLKLRPSDRLLLLFLADQANPDGLCRSGQGRIEKFTGLAPNTIRAATARLAEKQLIRVTTTVGMVTRYELLRAPTPANGAGVTPAKRHRVTPANSAGVAPQNVPTYPPTDCAEPPHVLRPTPANGAPVPSSSQESSPRARTYAREAGKVLSFGKKEAGTPPPASHTQQPTAPLAATTGSDDFNSFLDAPTPAKALPAEIEQEIVRADVPEPDAPLGPQATQGFVRSLTRSFQNNYPPRAPAFSRAEQIDLCQPKPHIKPAYLPEAVLRAARMQLAERATPS